MGLDDGAILAGLHWAGSPQGRGLAIVPGSPAPGSSRDTEPKSANAVKQSLKGKNQHLLVPPADKHTWVQMCDTLCILGVRVSDQATQPVGVPTSTPVNWAKWDHIFTSTFRIRDRV